MSGTQLQSAREGTITPAMERVAERENRDPAFVRERVAAGEAVIPANRAHDSLDPMIIGYEFATKVNANIGNSETTSDRSEELEKLHAAVHYRADTVMNLSTGEDLDAIREANVAHSPVPIGTMPIYEAVKRAESPEAITYDLLVDVIEKQAEQGVDYMTIHAGILMEHFPLTDGRLTGSSRVAARSSPSGWRKTRCKTRSTPSSRRSVQSSPNTTSPSTSVMGSGRGVSRTRATRRSSRNSRPWAS